MISIKKLLPAGAFVGIALYLAASPSETKSRYARAAIDRTSRFDALVEQCKKLCEPHGGVFIVKGVVYSSCECQDETIFVEKRR